MRDCARAVDVARLVHDKDRRVMFPAQGAKARQ